MKKMINAYELGQMSDLDDLKDFLKGYLEQQFPDVELIQPLKSAKLYLHEKLIKCLN